MGLEAPKTERKISMTKYRVKFYVDDNDKYEGRRSHSDISDSIEVEADTPEEAVELCLDYLTENISSNFFPVTDVTGRMTDKIPYAVERDGEKLFAYADGIKESLECYYNFVAEEA